MIDGLSWEAIGVVGGILLGVVTLVGSALCKVIYDWIMRGVSAVLAKIDEICATLTKMAADIAVLRERWQAGDREHAEFREQLTDHETRISTLEGQVGE